jgi:hypothetical protein
MRQVTDNTVMWKGVQNTVGDALMGLATAGFGLLLLLSHYSLNTHNHNRIIP